ncbi:hypothetical protein DFH06DRAFT_1195837 [Mycena polygramma]|nr:hypothetical protein DFH06DRAFT_1195837 [Mycena polygramma]
MSAPPNDRHHTQDGDHLSQSSINRRARLASSSLRLLRRSRNRVTEPQGNQPLTKPAPQCNPFPGHRRLPPISLAVRPFLPCSIPSIAPTAKDTPASAPRPIRQAAYKNVEFLPMVPNQVTTPLTAGFRYISPHRTMDSTQVTRYRMYTDDYHTPPIRVRIEAHLIQQEARFFTMADSAGLIISRGDVLRTYGDLSGRWVIDAKLFRTPDHTLLRVKERHDQLVAIFAIPHHLLDIPGNAERSQEFYDGFAHACPGLSLMERVHHAEELTWGKPAATDTTQALFPPPTAAASTIADTDMLPLLQWVEMTDPTTFL